MNDVGAAVGWAAGERLLHAHEPPPFASENPQGPSPLVLICEHAGRRMPERLGDLGVSAADLERHIAYDIGALGVARHLSARFDAPLLYQRYSRLVCDCNRKTTVPSFIPLMSESTRIPGNETMSPAERTARIAEIYNPFHAGVAAFLDAREREGIRPVVIAVHSFTPVFLGRKREWHVGVLYDRYRDLALSVLARLRQEPDLVVGENEPYVMSRESDFTIPFHAEDRGLPCLELEWRQDLIRDPEGQKLWADRIGSALEASGRELGLIA